MVSGPAPAAGPTATMTVGEMLDRRFEHAEGNLSPSTADHNRAVIDAHLLPHIGDTPLNKLTTAKIDALYRLLSERGARGGKPLAPSTVRRTHNVLHRALVQAVRWGWIGLNPAAAASPPRLPTRNIRPPTPDQVRLLFARAAAENPAFAVFLQLAASTGARRGELIALRWTDVNLAPGVVTIARGAVKGKDPPARPPPLVATRLLSSGVDVRTVAGRLGHKNPNVTLSVYAHFLPEADREAADVLGRILAPPETAEYLLVSVNRRIFYGL